MSPKLQGMQETCNDEKKILRTPSAITCIEYEKILRKVMNTKLQKTRFFLIKKLNKHPSSIAWDRRQLKVKLANINVSINQKVTKILYLQAE